MHKTQTWTGCYLDWLAELLAAVTSTRRAPVPLRGIGKGRGLTTAGTRYFTTHYTSQRA